jgi:hypothetical protein
MPGAIPNPMQEAAAAIVALINSSPRSPRQEEIEAILARVGTAPTREARPISDLRIRIRKAIAQAEAALHVVGELPAGPKFELAQADLNTWEDEIAALEDDIPNPPRSYDDLLARAEVARHGGDVVDGKLMEAENQEDVFVGPAARLVEAVLQYRGAQPGAASMSPAHAAHYREWRCLVDHHMREFENPNEEGMSKAEIEAEEARMAAHMEIMESFAHQVFAVPARTWGDVLLLAEICLWFHAPGTDPEAPTASSDLQDSFSCDGEMPDTALAKLLEAVFSVARVGQFGGEVRHG